MMWWYCGSASQLSVTVTNERGNHFKRIKGLLWLMVSEASDHGHLIPFVFGPVMVGTCGTSLFTSWQLGSKEKRRGQGPRILFKGMSPMI